MAIRSATIDGRGALTMVNRRGRRLRRCRSRRLLLELGSLASGTSGARTLATHGSVTRAPGTLVPRGEEPLEPSARLLAHDPVDSQALALLECPHRARGPGAKAPVDRPRVLAHPNQLALKRPDAA